MEAVSPVVPTKVVVRGLAFHCTVEQGSNPLPTTETTKAPLPAAALDGMRELMDGTGKDEGAVIAIGRELELIAELDTNTVAVPSAAVSASVMAALSCEPLTNVVGRGEPFQFTTVSLVNVVPAAAFTVSVKPAGAQYGVVGVVGGVVGVNVGVDSVEIARPVTVNGAELDVPPPGAGVKTVTGTAPAAERSEAGMVALSCVGLTYVVARGDPFHCTTEHGTKLVPVTFKMNCPDPTVALEGFSGAVAWRAGIGKLVVGATSEKLIGLETAEPFDTVMGILPAAVASENGMMAVR
jgi:hypothetical protein